MKQFRRTDQFSDQNRICNSTWQNQNALHLCLWQKFLLMPRPLLNLHKSKSIYDISPLIGFTFRKIVKLVSSYMTEEAICGYIGNLRESFWPQGHRTVAPEPKSIQDRYRTKFMAKVKLYGSISSKLHFSTLRKFSFSCSQTLIVRNTVFRNRFL